MKRIKALSLAALVAFGACDEGTEPIVAPPVTGTISGVVTIEGAARSGVSVTLSSGAAATTDASGAFSFAGVNAGTYTVTISGFPTDATFTTTTKGATITTSGQVATVNFDGAFVRTAAILGSVSVAGQALTGVRVALTGANAPAGANVNTDANGQYAFSGLRAGSYTLTISGFDATQFAFASTTATVTVAVGESKSTSFSGTRLATSKITGKVTIDGAAAAAVTATLNTGATEATDATGTYTFSNLVVGTYTVTISGFASDARFDAVSKPVTIASAGSTVSADFAGAYVKTSAIRGTVAVGGTGIAGVSVEITGGPKANTDANGQYEFTGLRAGTYTLTISGWSATEFSFASTTASVTVGVGESKVASFAGARIATAKITGTVTIEGAAQSGVAVGLSTGAAATTAADGSYTFSGLTVGTYTVTISGFAADAQFSPASRSVTLASATATGSASFAGTYVRTSTIQGAVTVGGRGIQGVAVSLTGGSSTSTDGNGQYSFTGLRAGSYTVTIAGWDSGQYTFSATTASVTVAMGGAGQASFSGALLATAKITGTVKIDGAAAAGVTATLSTGAVNTTGADGVYTFSNLTVGSYTVTISGYAADVIFETAARPVTISAAGSTVAANFSGDIIKTSVITGFVSVTGGAGIAGVTVTLSNGSTTTTDASGQYAFSALRGGTYTVTISGFDALTYSFASTSASRTVATGSSATASFTGSYLASATISGSLFLDESDDATTDGNGTFDTALESALKIAGITVTAEGGAVNSTQTTTTNANGAFSFSVIPGTYRVTLSLTGTPAGLTPPATLAVIRVVAARATETANFPFTITTQFVKVGAFLGKDADVALPAGVAPKVRALDLVTIDLYTTQANATAGGATGRLSQKVTGTDGYATFSYARTADTSPQGATDNIVFARFNSTTRANKSLNGEAILEIRYSAKDSLITASDEFDFLNTGAILRFDAKQPDGALLRGWAVALYRNATDTVIAGTALQSGITHATSGLGRFVEAYGIAALPDTFYIRLADAGAQAAANLHNFSQTPSPLDGSAGGRFLRYVVDGTNPDSIFVGTQNILWTDQDLYVRAHNEVDDTVNFTTLDAVAMSSNLDAQVYRVNPDGTKVAVAGQGPFALDVVTGAIVFGINGTIPTRLPTGTYEVRARRRVATQTMLADTAVTIVLDGSKQQDTVKAKMASATHPRGYSSFAWKHNNTIIAGTVRALDGTNADGITVNIKSDANFIGPVRDTTITIAGGSYSRGGLLEGPYTVTASGAGLEASWQLLVSLVGNTSATLASRETQGSADDKIANFRATRMDTQVRGVVINDRDQDLSTIDPDEALSGATIQIYRDGSGAITLDTLVATTTTDASGNFSFTGLVEGRYITKGISLGNALVLRGEAKDTAVVTTAATTVGSGANNTRVVGATPPAVLPRWDYNNSVADGGYLPGNFTFLFTNTTVKGTVKTGGGVAIPGMLISLRRCNVSAGATSPPSGAGVCTTYLGTTVNMSSDAAGAFQFDAQREGVYEIRPQPTTVAGWTTSTPAQILYITVGNGDVENYNFVIS